MASRSTPGTAGSGLDWNIQAMKASIEWNSHQMPRPIGYIHCYLCARAECDGDGPGAATTRSLCLRSRRRKPVFVDTVSSKSPLSGS